MTLLDRLRAATAADLDRDAADVLGLTPGATFRASRDGLTVGDETVPFDVVCAEMSRVLAGPAREPASPRITITDL